MRRKTSTVPTKVFKYGLQSPTVNGRLVDEIIYLAHKFYNKLIEIVRTGRTAYRTERSKRFPKLVVVETEVARLTAEIKTARDKIEANKILKRTRAIDTISASVVNKLCEARKLLKPLLKELRTSCKSDPSFAEWTSAHNATTNASITAARNSCGVAWGTYNLIAASVQQACKDAKLDPEFKHYKGEGRIGVQIQGGMSVSDLATNTQLQIAMPNLHDGLSRGEWRRNSRTLVKMRVGSDDKRRPIWAEFPAIIHRLLPDDARIMGAIITRRRLGIFRRWSYELCISCESNKFNKTSSNPKQRGVAAVNFGWRQFEDGLRIATINNDATGIEEIRLPAKITDRFTKCDDLRSTIDTQFNAIRVTLTTWLKAHRSDAPEWLIKSLEYLHLWKQPEHLDRVVGNWAGLRFASDTDIFPLLFEWRTKWRHLTEWMMRNRRQGLNMRKDFYRTTAARIVQHTSRLVIETFNVSEVAVLPKPEEETTGGPKARHNRFMAAISELRRCLLLAASKYHCAVYIVKPTNNTLRCNVCGRILDWDPAKEVVRECPDCSKWDQDVNNTDNAMTRLAGGEVVPMVVPAEVTKNGKITPSKTSTYKAARNELRNLLITQ